MTRRRFGAVVILLVAMALAFGSPASAGSSSEALFTASATGAAVHGFYDHQGTFPVPILDLSAPYTEAAFEPGPASTALGSFLWDPQAAELGTIFCQLSNGQMCQIPDYPFQAKASYPSNGGSGSPPRLSISKKGAPVRVQGADETAAATQRGSSATGTVGGLAAVPMNQQQIQAASDLATVVAAVRARSSAPGGRSSTIPSLPIGPSKSAGGAAAPKPKTTPWLVSIGAATSSSTTRASSGGAVSQGFSAASDVELLGGLVTIESVRGEATATVGSSANGKADARAAGVQVGGFKASIGPRGVQMQDKRLGPQQLKALEDGLDKALKQAGISVTPGREHVRRGKKKVSVEAYAFGLEVDKQVVPAQAPEGVNGKDELEVPVGFASAEAERSSLGIGSGGGGSLPPPPPAGGSGGIAAPPPAAPPPGFSGGGSGGTVGPPPAAGGAGPSVVSGGNGAGVPKGQAARVSARPASGTLALGVPGIVVAVVVLGALGLVAGLTWLKTLEVLTE